MTARISVSGLAVLASLTTTTGAANAQQAQFMGRLSVPSYDSQTGQRPRQPLFPVPPLDVPQPRPLPESRPSLPASPNQPAALTRPRIVCGMTLLPAPDIDAKIGQRQAPERPNNPTTYTIRPVQPSICWD